jgi:hypothetical protein
MQEQPWSVPGYLVVCPRLPPGYPGYLHVPGYLSPVTTGAILVTVADDESESEGAGGG